MAILSIKANDKKTNSKVKKYANLFMQFAYDLLSLFLPKTPLQNFICKLKFDNVYKSDLEFDNFVGALDCSDSTVLSADLCTL